MPFPEQPIYWYYGTNEEYLQGQCATREEAIAAGAEDWAGDPYFVISGRRFTYQFPNITHSIQEEFDDDNYEYGPEDDGPSVNWTDEQIRELERDIQAAGEAWMLKHNLHTAWAIETIGNPEWFNQSEEGTDA